MVGLGLSLMNDSACVQAFKVPLAGPFLFVPSNPGVPFELGGAQ